MSTLRTMGLLVALVFAQSYRGVAGDVQASADGRLQYPQRFFVANKVVTNLLGAGAVTITSNNMGEYTITASGGSGDAGGTNARQFGSLGLTNASANPNLTTNLSGAGSVTVTSNNLGGWTISGSSNWAAGGSGLIQFGEGAGFAGTNRLSYDRTNNWLRLISTGGRLILPYEAQPDAAFVYGGEYGGWTPWWTNSNKFWITTSDGDNATHYQVYPAVAQGPSATLSNLANNNRIGFLIVTAYVRAGSVQIDTNLSVSATGQVSYAQVSNKLFVAGTSLISGLYNTNGATNTGALLCAGPAFFTSTYSTNFSTNKTFVYLSVPYSGTTNKAVVGPVTNQWDFTLADWKQMTNNLGQQTNLCFQLTNLVPGGYQRTVLYGNASGVPTNEFFTNWITCPNPSTVRILWLDFQTNGYNDFILRTNRSVLLELRCDRATNVFVQVYTNNANWALP